MVLSFCYFIGFIQIFNTLSQAIISLPRTLIDDKLLKNIISIVTCICVRGSTLARLAVVLLLLSIGNTPAPRVTLREGRILPLYESLLFEKEGYFHSTSHYSSRRKNTSTLRVITLREGRILPLYESLLFEGRISCSTSYYSSSFTKR